MNASWQEKMLETFKLASNNDFFNEQMLLEIIKFYPDQGEEIKKMHSFISQHQKNLLTEGVASGDIRPDIDINVLGIIVEIRSVICC